jgi:two-component system chemotaxis sensor kinase CheA
MAIDLNRFIATFFDEAQEHVESIEEKAMLLDSGREDPEVLNAIFRAAHSIKGGSGTFGFTQLADATHVMETLFDDLRKGRGKADAGTVRLLLDACDVFKGHIAMLKGGERGVDPTMDAIRERFSQYRGSEAVAPAQAGAQLPQEESFFAASPATPKETFGLFEDSPGAPRAAAPAVQEKFGFFENPAAVPAAKTEQSSIRVSVEKIDRIVNLVGELVIAQAMMQQSVGKVVATHEDEHLAHSLSTLDRNTRELQQAVMSIRMMPMEFVFSRFPRLVYDVSTQLGKKGAACAPRPRDRARQGAHRAARRPAHARGAQRDRPRHRAARRARSRGQARGGLDRHARDPPRRQRRGRRDRRRAAASTATASSPRRASWAFRPTTRGPTCRPGPHLRGGLHLGEGVTSLSGRGVGMDVVAATSRTWAAASGLEREGQGHHHHASGPAHARGRSTA